MLLTKDGTRAKVLSALRAAAKTLVKGDFFFLTYSGHGGQVPDVSGEEADKLDETWCLYDGQLIDDELYLELGKFATGVRILVLSDSCHSGTVVRAGPPALGTPTPELRSKMMPPSVAMRTYEAHKAFYDKLQMDVAKAEGGPDDKAEPDEVLATLTVSTRLTKIAKRFKPRAILDLRLPGQPEQLRRRPQRRLHRAAARPSGTAATSTATTPPSTRTSRAACRPSRRRTCSRWGRWPPS